MFQACGRSEDCIELYKYLEVAHPSRRLQKQAYELRYIMEAPKLELSPDERVSIPLIESDSWRKTGWVANSYSGGNVSAATVAYCNNSKAVVV